MSTLMVRNADLVVTMDDDRREIASCDVLVRDSAIVEVGPKLESEADETFDAQGCLVIPGLINTHNHMWGTLYRGLPDAVDVALDRWFGQFADRWHDRPLTPDALYAAALANMGKHLLTGCTTSNDHHWVYKRGIPLDFVDREIDAAREIGMRFHPSRGCMTLGESDGGNMPDDLTEPEDQVLNHAQELIDRYHDPSPYAMVRIQLSPTGVYSDSETIFREMRKLAQSSPGVTCPVHLYAGVLDRAASEALHGMTPLEFLEHVDWRGDDVMYYHFDTDDPSELNRVVEAGTWVSVCASVDLRMGYYGPKEGQIPPVRELLDGGGKVCFGTSNPAAHEGAGMLDDMWVCLLAERMRFDEPEKWLTARDVLWLATRGSALGLGRDDLGMIAPGKAADLAIFDLTTIDMAGHQDPVAYLTGSCAYTKATIVNGRLVARDGRLLTVDQDEVARNCNAEARKLVPR